MDKVNSSVHDIQRWKFMPDQGCLAGSPDGEWVDYEDYKKLQSTVVDRVLVDENKTELIRIGAYALQKRPMYDSETSKRELKEMLDAADEALRQVGIRARKLYDTIGDN